MSLSDGKFTIRIMSATVTAQAKVTKKKTASTKPKKVSDHPKYAEMIKDALTNLKVLTPV